MKKIKAFSLFKGVRKDTNEKVVGYFRRTNGATGERVSIIQTETGTIHTIEENSERVFTGVFDDHERPIFDKDYITPMGKDWNIGGKPCKLAQIKYYSGSFYMCWAGPGLSGKRELSAFADRVLIPNQLYQSQLAGPSTISEVLKSK